MKIDCELINIMHMPAFIDAFSGDIPDLFNIKGQVPIITATKTAHTLELSVWVGSRFIFSIEDNSNGGKMKIIAGPGKNKKEINPECRIKKSFAVNAFLGLLCARRQLTSGLWAPD